MKTKLIISASNKVGIVMLSKYVLCGLLFATLCFSQSKRPGVEERTHTDSFDKSISLEVFVGTHLTSEHEMSGVMLPDYMLLGGLRIRYQPSRCIVFSCAGSYSHASNLDFIWGSPVAPPVKNLTYTYVDFQVAYTNKIAGNLNFLLGTGLDISHLRLLLDDTTASNNDATVSSTYLRPLVSGGLRFHISHSLYSQIQAKCCFYHLLKTGDEHIHLADISPSVSLGIGYTFGFKEK